MGLLLDKNAVIYGAGGAIGGAVARAFASRDLPALWQQGLFLTEDRIPAGDTRPLQVAVLVEIVHHDNIRVQQLGGQLNSPLSEISHRRISDVMAKPLTQTSSR